MKRAFPYLTISKTVLIFFIFVQCTEFERITGFSEVGVEEITTGTAIFFLEFGDVKDPETTEFGFCWAEYNEPTIFDSTFSFGFDPIINKRYSTLIESFRENKQYFVRAFAKNGRIITYSIERNFNTMQDTLVISPGLE